MTYRAKIELTIAAIIAAIALLFIWQASLIGYNDLNPIGPRVFPMSLAIILLAGAFMLAVDGCRGPSKPIHESYGFKDCNVPRVLSVVGSGVVFLATFWAFGYFVATLISTIAILYSFGTRNSIYIVTIATIVAIVYQSLFMGAMGLFDPPGRLMDLRDYTNWISGAY